MKRSNINECPADATHVKMNPTNKFIELFYRVADNNINFLSTCGGGWQHSFEADKDVDFINRLTKIN